MRAGRLGPAPSPHPAVQAAVVEVGGGAVDLAARQAGGAQRIDVDDVIVGVDDLVDARAHLPQLVVLQPQTEDGLLDSVPSALQGGGEPGAPGVGGDVVGENDGQRHDAPLHL